MHMQMLCFSHNVYDAHHVLQRAYLCGTKAVLHLLHRNVAVGEEPATEGHWLVAMMARDLQCTFNRLSRSCTA